MPDDGTYDIAGLPRRPPPRLPGAVVHRADEDTLIDAALADLYLQAIACVKEFGNFQMAVSASPRLEALFLRLMIDPDLREFPWARTHLWLADEYAQEAGHPSRFDMLTEAIAHPSGIPSAQVHGRVLKESGPDAYESELREVLGWREKGHDRLDYIMLPLSSDGAVGEHAPLTSDQNSDEEPLVVSVNNASTLSARFIRAGRMVAIWAPGTAMANRLRLLEKMHAGEVPGAAAQSALAIEPLGGDLRWYIDAPACCD